MIDQEQVRKYWTGWVRRQIGGSQIVQEAAVSAAISAVVAGRDNDAAAEAARQVARSLGVKLAGDRPDVKAAPFPGPLMPGQPTASSTGSPGISPSPAMTTAVDGQPLRCRLCGSTPAANMTIHEHNGRIVWMVHKTAKGPFCRDCGTALLRHHQNSTLFQGWFGIFSFFITPITLLLNLGAWRKVRSLAPPQREAGVDSRIPAPLNPGQPVFRRPGLYVGGVVVAAVAIFLAAKSADTGGCLDSDTDRANRVTDLHNAFIDVFNRDWTVLNGCPSISCERAPELDIASALNTYSHGLNQVCWPDNLKAEANSLTQANATMATAYTAWSNASNDSQDHSLGSIANSKTDDQQAADDRLARDLGIPTASPSPS